MFINPTIQKLSAEEIYIKKNFSVVFAKLPGSFNIYITA